MIEMVGTVEETPALVEEDWSVAELV